MCVTVDPVSNGHHCNFQTKELYIPSKLRKANVVNLEETSKFPTEGQKRAGKHCNLFVKCMRQVKSHVYHLDYSVLYRQKAQSVLLNVCSCHQPSN